MITKPSQPWIWRTLGISSFDILGIGYVFFLLLRELNLRIVCCRGRFYKNLASPGDGSGGRHTCIGWREEENSCSKWRVGQKWWESGSLAMRHRRPQNETLQTAVYSGFSLSLSPLPLFVLPLSTHRLWRFLTSWQFLCFSCIVAMLLLVISILDKRTFRMVFDHKTS